MENVYSKISVSLNKMLAENRFDLVEICSCAMLLSEELPLETVDLQTIVEKSYIDLVFQPLMLKENSHKLLSKIYKGRNFITKKEFATMFVNNMTRFEDQRFAIAHELAIHLIHMQERSISHEYRTMPLLPISSELLIAEAFACFLLLPFTSVIKELSIYTRDATDIPQKSSDWLMYLSTISKVPYELSCIGFNNIRYVTACLKNDVFEKNSFLEQKQKMFETLWENSSVIL